MTRCATFEAIATYVAACQEGDQGPVLYHGVAATVWEAWLDIYRITPSTVAGATLIIELLDAFGDELPATHLTLGWTTPGIVRLMERGLEPSHLPMLRFALGSIQNAMALDVAAGRWCDYIALGLESFTRFALSPQLAITIESKMKQAIGGECPAVSMKACETSDLTGGPSPMVVSLSVPSRRSNSAGQKCRIIGAPT